jgi:hypothetical protein
MHEPLPWRISERIGHDGMLFRWRGLSTRCGCYAFGEVGILDFVPFSSSSTIRVNVTTTPKYSIGSITSGGIDVAQE